MPVSAVIANGPAAAPAMGRADLAAGVLTALVFYAEYISLGTQLGSRLGGAGEAGSSLGLVLVFGSVLICGLLAQCRPFPLLSGPRAASLAIMYEGLKRVQPYMLDVGASAQTYFMAMLVMAFAALLMQCAGLWERVRNLVIEMEPAVIKGFMYATAISIIAGMVYERLAGCLALDFWRTTGVFAVSLGFALAWTRICDSRVAWARYKALALVIGAGTAWAGVAVLLPAASSMNGCGNIGGAGLHWEIFADRLPDPARPLQPFDNLPLSIWILIAGHGLIVGLIQLVESLTTLRDVEPFKTNHGLWRGYVGLSMVSNAITGLLGFSPSSYSTSRSVALQQAGGGSRISVLVHGGILLVLVTVGTPLVGRVPLLAVSVALAMVAVQMIDTDMSGKVWKLAFQKSATPLSVQAGWRFWITVLVSLYSSAAWGLLVGAILFWLTLIPSQMKKGVAMNAL